MLRDRQGVVAMMGAATGATGDAMGRWGGVALSPHVDVRNLYCGGKD